MKIIKRLFIALILLFFIFLINENIFALDPELNQLMQQGNNIVCLNAKEKNVNRSNDWRKPVTGTITLSGATCNSSSGCQIFQCNSGNNEIAQDERLLKICKTNPSKWAGCSKPGKTDSLENKIKNSVDVKPGCKKIMDVPQGPVSVNINGSWIIHVDYQYYLSQPANVQSYGQGDNIASGEFNSQQIGIFNFNQIEGSAKDCVVISWDPFGRVFDAVSLEPIENIKVTLIDNLTNLPALMNFNYNYDITDERGVFNIQVEKEGKYKLNVREPETHTFSSSINLNPNYRKIYSDIYFKDQVFEEKTGVPTHHDIPLKPKGPPYKGAIARLIENSLESYISGDSVIYRGKTTFPFSKVCLIGAESNKVIGNCINADKYGKYSISLKKNLVPKEFLEVSVQKVDLNNIANALLPVNRIKGVGYEPIFSYIEGYAYDDFGNLLVNSNVSIKLSLNNDEFYKTTTDKNGYFVVYKENLPFINYYLEFSNSKESVRKTTSKFAKDNKNYLNKNNIDLLLNKKNGQLIKNPSVKNYKNNNSINQSINQKNNIEDKKPKNNIFLTLIILIFILLILAILIVILFLRKNNYL